MATQNKSKYSNALASLNPQPREPDKAQTLAEVPTLAQDDEEQPTAKRGKRSDPAFERTTVYLGKKTKKNANRKLEDIDSEMDLSDLIERLLQDWISAKQTSSSSDV